MRIKSIAVTPLSVPYAKPYHWARGTIHSAEVILIAVHTEDGVVGFGECISSPSAAAMLGYLERAIALCVDRSVFEVARLAADVEAHLFGALGTGSNPRLAAQVLAGIEMACWDAAGKGTGLAVHELFGGAVRESVPYFGFAQGETTDELVADARALAAKGHAVIYFKGGRGDALDLETARAIRGAVGPAHRIRIDPNEKWSLAHARRMAIHLGEWGIEAIEQPTSSQSISALAQVRAGIPMAVMADQAVFNSFDAFEIARQGAADVIVVGPHEAGGLLRLQKVAHVAEAAGIDLCIHGLYETGITTSASHHLAATVANLDDGNQHMVRFLAWDIVRSPDLIPHKGSLPIFTGPGLGISINDENVERAHQRYRSAPH